MSRTASQAYGTQQVMTSSPAKLIALLYDKAIVSLKEAVRAIEAGQIEKRWQANRKAIDIITHLASTLDHQNGGEIAGNLEQLYDFMLKRLLEVDLKNDAEAASDVITLLLPLRDSWYQLADAPEASAAGGEARGPRQGPEAAEVETAAPDGAPAGSGLGKARGDGGGPTRQPINLSA